MQKSKLDSVTYRKIHFGSFMESPIAAHLKLKLYKLISKPCGMRPLYVQLFRYSLLLALVLQLSSSFSQVLSPLPSPTKNIEVLETAIWKKKMLSETQRELEAIKKQALESQNDILFARAVFNLMKLKDQRTEDTLYFRNSAFLDTLLRTNVSSKLKAILYLMRAKRIGGFDSERRRFNLAAYHTRDLIPNYAALSSTQRDSLVLADLKASRQYHDQTINGKQLLWLSSNPNIFLFEPKFEDIVFAEQVNLFVSKGFFDGEQKIESTDWLALSSTAFRDKLDSLSRTSNHIPIFSAYQQWLVFNNGNETTSSFIESLARKYLYLAVPADSVAEQYYIKYLQESATSRYLPLKAHAIYQLCLLWNKEGNRYANLANRRSYESFQGFHPEYQFYPLKALELYEANRHLLAQYPVLNRVLELMAKQIRLKGVNVEMEDQHLPNEAIPIKIIYRNVDVLYYRIIKISSTDYVKNIGTKATAELLARQVEAQGNFVLPLPADHNRHAVYLKLPQLPVGHYQLLFGRDPLRVADSLSHIAFTVTDIAAINTDEKIFVLHRKTGFPLVGAQIKMFKRKISLSHVKSVVVGKNGFIEASVADSINIVYKGDTTGYSFTVDGNDLDDEVYSKDEYDDLTEFYDDHVRMEIFTDRSIYRPGQTVHYKMILLTNDPNTGDPMLFNRQNLGGGIFKNRLKKWLGNGNDKITLQDPFEKPIDSAVLRINDFGSFAGSFTIPKNAATGEWQIEASPETRYNNNSGTFSVEEYKRPTVELGIDKQKRMLKPGEPFVVKFKLRSLSGADLGNIPIRYAIERSGRLPGANTQISNRADSYSSTELLNQNGYTNSKGELLITVTDSLVAKAMLDDQQVWNFNYHITATAVDATGESTEMNEFLPISSRPIKINMQLSKIYDKQDLPVINISTTADFEGSVGKMVNVKLYRITNPDHGRTQVKYVDQWYYNRLDWNEWFPAKKEINAEKEEKTLMVDTLINTATYEKLIFNKKDIQEGVYQLIAECRENGKLMGETIASFKVFDSKATNIPVADVDYMPFNSAKPGAWITWYSSSKKDRYTIYQLLYVGIHKKKVLSNSYQTRIEKAGINLWRYQIPTDAIGQILINKIYVDQNTIEKTGKLIYVDGGSKNLPEIIVEKYRKVMLPGAQETFTLSVKTKNDNVAAELLTTLYDASLDKIEEHKWRLPEMEAKSNYLYTSWNNSLTSLKNAGNYVEGPTLSYLKDFGQDGIESGLYTLQDRILGLSINDASGLSEVIVLEYGTVRQNLSSAVRSITLRGSSSLLDYEQPLIVVDGEVYNGDLKNIDPLKITQGLVLKGADASAIYGSRAAGGVLILSTKGPIVLPVSEPPIVKVRKNFNETAFFLPQVHAGADGYYTFSFTMPETATEWNWKMFAHTRKAKFAYLEKKLQTQLNLMVQPSMPRVLYQGDRITLQSRITNLDTLTLSGKATCRIEDAVSGEDLTAKLTVASSRQFVLNEKSSGTVSFLLHVPDQQLNPLKVIIGASGNSSGDAEEHIIPVLSTQVFTRQSQAIHFTDQPKIILSPVKLPINASLYGIGISIAPKPEASLVYALPWLANYSYDCAEQTFNKLRARVTAFRLMQQDSAMQKVFKKAIVALPQEKSMREQLPDDLADETMPWLGLSNQSQRQQKQLTNLLDTIGTKKSIGELLDKLYQLQRPNGGITWFQGGESNAYISAYILAGFGQLRQMGWIPEAIKSKKQAEFILSLFNHQQSLLNASLENPQTNLFVLYALSYWHRSYPLAEQTVQKMKFILSKGWEDIDKKSLTEQSLLIINTLRFTSMGDNLYKKAQLQLESIKQLAIQDANGLRWKDFSDAEELNNNKEETMALLAEAFELSGKFKDIQAGIIKWLLTAKQDEHWQTTKATAAAIDLLQKNQELRFDGNKVLSAELNGQELSVSDDLLSGTSTSILKTNQVPQSIAIKQQGKKANGSITWYYFAEPSKLDTLNKGIKINKQFLIYNDNRGWLPVSAETPLKVGDRIQVKLSIETAFRLKFVHINDPRAAAFEPKEKRSGYKYSNGLSYYLSIRDTGLDFFAESVPKGISVLTYELIVAHSGEFTNGPAKLQCMYQPSQTAYSGATKIQTKSAN